MEIQNRTIVAPYYDITNMSASQSFDLLLAQLLASRAHERDILARMTALFESPAGTPAQIAAVYAMAREAWGADALGFLTRPHPLLGGELPLCLAMQDEAGAHQVEQLLGRLIHGTAV